MKGDVEERVQELLKTLDMYRALAALSDSLPAESAKRVAALKGIERVLRAEVDDRRERRIQRRIKESKLPDKPTLQAFDFDFQPNLDRDLVLELATIAWVDRKEDLVLVGDSGTGKSHIAKALCLIACSQERRTRYTTCADMMAELYAALADGSLPRVIKRYTRPTLLLIDDLGYDPIEQDHAREAQLLYKVLEVRHQKRSTIITSNLDAKAWAEYLGDHYLTVALLDRLLYHATSISIKGPSWRLSQHEKMQKERSERRKKSKKNKKSQKKRPKDRK